MTTPTTPAIEQLMAARQATLTESPEGAYTKSAWEMKDWWIAINQGHYYYKILSIGCEGNMLGEDVRATGRFIVLAHTLLPTVAAEMERLQKALKSCPNCAGKIGDSGHCEECIQRDNANEARINELESSLSQLLDRAAAAEAKATPSRVFECDQCHSVFDSTDDECPECGHEECGAFTAEDILLAYDNNQILMKEVAALQSSLSAAQARAEAAEARATDEETHHHRLFNQLYSIANRLMPEGDYRPSEVYPAMITAVATLTASLQSSESARQAAEERAREFAMDLFLSGSVTDPTKDDKWRGICSTAKTAKKAAEYLFDLGLLERRSERNEYRLLPQEEAKEVQG